MPHHWNHGDTISSYHYCVMTSFLYVLSLLKWDTFISGPNPSCKGVTCKDRGQCDIDIVSRKPKCVCALSQSGTMCESSKI